MTASVNSSASNTSGGSGPPTLMTVNVSNSQAEELIRQRRARASRQSGAVASLPKPVYLTGGSELSPGAVQYVGAYGATIPYSSTSAAGAWFQVYGDYERHSNLAPGTPDNTTREQTTFGQIAGIDTTYFRGTEILQLGFLAGHNDTRSKFRDTENIKNASQADEGGFIGGYATYQVGRFAVEGLIKADLFQHTERATVKKQVACEGTDVLIVDSDADLQTAAPRKGEVSENNFTAATNFSYRFDLSGGYWLEPLVGVRYTYTDFGSGADALDLTDGQVLRVQGGLRLGTAQPWQGYTLGTSVLGMLYSDVLVTGYMQSDGGFTSTGSKTDEGKLRGLAQLVLTLEDQRGLSYSAQVEVRGGEDLIGVGGRLGVRYRW
jgi:Autotransporter beta-domain